MSKGLYLYNVTVKIKSPHGYKPTYSTFKCCAFEESSGMESEASAKASRIAMLHVQNQNPGLDFNVSTKVEVKKIHLAFRIKDDDN